MNKTLLFLSMFLLVRDLNAQISTGGAYSLDSSVFGSAVSAQNSPYALVACVGHGSLLMRGPWKRIYGGFFSPLKIDPSLSYVMSLEGGEIQIVIPAGAIAQAYEIMPETDPISYPITTPAIALQQAFEDIVSEFGAYVNAPLEAIELRVLLEDNTLFTEDLAGTAEFTLAYTDRGDGGPISIEQLDEDQQRWVELNNPSINGTVAQFFRTHFGMFAVFQLGPMDVANTYAFPVPWRPNANNPGLYGTLQDGITFTNLPTVGLIRIYNIVGEMVREIIIPPGSMEYEWDGNTGSGHPVASGVYVWIVAAERHQKTGKLMVIR